MIEYYEMHDEEGVAYRCEVDLTLFDDAPQEERPWLLWLFVKAADPLNEEFIAFRQDLIDTLSQELDSLYAGTITKDGWSELYFYAPISKRFENITSSVMERHAPYAYERASAKDTKWELYLDRLYPDPYAALTIQNRHTIEALIEAGDDLSIPREVEHYLFFQTSSASERFNNAMSNHGFSLKESFKDDESDYAYGIILVKTEPILAEQVEETTAMLYEAVLQEHGHYEGWSTVLG